MGFYIRKSVKAGPFRFNLSNSGVGVSVGVRGLRVGSGPRGTYIRAGLGGIYYQQSLRAAGDKLPRRSSPVRRPAPAPVTSAPGVVMREVESSTALEMRDAGFRDLLDDLNRKHRQLRMSTVLGGSGLAACAAADWMLASGPAWPGVQGAALAASAIVVLIGWGFGRWLDSYRRVAVLAYDLDDQVTTSYEGVAAAFATLAASSKKFRVDAGGAVHDLTTWKRNAGASHLLKTEPIVLDHQLPAVVRSNIMPPALRTGSRTLYFMPDVLLIADRGGFGAVGYADLQLETQPSHFIEGGTTPPDAHVTGHTWQHPNKGGGPDRRFKANRQLPICLYDVLHLSSSSGLNELLEFSRAGSVPPFLAAVQSLPRQGVAMPTLARVVRTTC